MKNKRKIKDITFFSLTSRDQKKIIKAAAKAANKDQRDLVTKYEKFCNDLKPAYSCK